MPELNYGNINQNVKFLESETGLSFSRSMCDKIHCPPTVIQLNVFDKQEV